MPRIPFSAENKAESIFDYPKLKLEKNERARIVCIEKTPQFEYTHTLRAPQIINGEAATEMIKQRDGTEVEQVKYDFIGRHICIGDYDRISEKGSDPDNCPVCRASTESEAVQAPTRRFAMHVIKYQTRSGSFDVSDPFGVTLVAWAFGDQIYNKLVDTATEWGDLQKHDLLLGPCQVVQFQKFDIAVAARAEWMANDDRKRITLETYKSNQCKDLTTLIGRKVDRPFIEQDLDKVLTRYRIAFSGGPTTVDLTSNGEAASALDLDKLLADDVPATVVAEGTVGVPSFDVLDEAEKKDEPTLSFDDLLDSI